MMQRDAIYIGGEWVEANGEGTIEVVNPATEQTIGSVPVGSSSDVDAAVAAARTAFPEWSASSLEARIEALNAISAALKERGEELARSLDGRAVDFSELETYINEKGGEPAPNERLSYEPYS